MDKDICPCHNRQLSDPPHKSLPYFINTVLNTFSVTTCHGTKDYLIIHIRYVLRTDHMSAFDEAALSRDNKEMVALANRKRILLTSSPSQSFFRVYCILVVQVGENIVFVEGEALCL